MIGRDRGATVAGQAAPHNRKAIGLTTLPARVLCLLLGVAPALAGPAAPTRVVATQDGEGFVIHWTAPPDVFWNTSSWRVFYYAVRPGEPVPSCGDGGFTGRLVPDEGSVFAVAQTSTTLTASTPLFAGARPFAFEVGTRYMFCVAGVDATTFIYDYAPPSVVSYAAAFPDSGGPLAIEETEFESDTLHPPP